MSEKSKTGKVPMSTTEARTDVSIGGVSRVNVSS